MSNTLLTAGLVCIIAAIVGGGLKAFGIEIGILRSWKRQGLLAMFGAVMLVTVYVMQRPPTPQPPPVEVLLFDNKNNYRVSNNPPRPAEFKISQAYYVTSVWDYHWNEGEGATAGNIGLRRGDGVRNRTLSEFGSARVAAGTRGRHQEAGSRYSRSPCCAARKRELEKARCALRHRCKMNFATGSHRGA